MMATVPWVDYKELGGRNPESHTCSSATDLYALFGSLPARTIWPDLRVRMQGAVHHMQVVNDYTLRFFVQTRPTELSSGSQLRGEDGELVWVQLCEREGYISTDSIMKFREMNPLACHVEVTAFVEGTGTDKVRLHAVEVCVYGGDGEEANMLLRMGRCTGEIFQTPRRNEVPNVLTRLQDALSSSNATFLADQTRAKKKSRQQKRPSNAARGRKFACWVANAFADHLKDKDGYILDVAGGNGLFSGELAVRYGISCTVVDPRKLVLERVIRNTVNFFAEHAETHQLRKLCLDLQSDAPEYDRVNSWEGVSSGNVTFRALNIPFDPAFADTGTETREVFDAASLVVGLHADQPTEAILDLALEYNKPAAVVPCCVFWRANPHRILASGKPVRSYYDFIDFLLEKDPRIIKGTLPFPGRNVVLYFDPNRKVDGGEWTCSICGATNDHSSRRRCKACGSAEPTQTLQTEVGGWWCRLCKLPNGASRHTCRACKQRHTSDMTGLESS